MQFLFSNGMTIFVPAVSPSHESLHTFYPFFVLLYTLELICIFTIIPGSMLLINALGRSTQLFHANLIKILQLHLISVTISQTLRMLVFCYDISIFKTSGSSDVLLSILLSSRFLFLCCLPMIIPAITFERWLASHYINNYEKTDRSWISTLANGSSIVLTVAFCLLFQLGLYFMLFITLFTAGIFLISFFAVVATYRRDLAKLRDLSNEAGTSTITYTLSMKFQLAENVRVTKMLTVASIGMTPWGFGGCGIFVVSYIMFGEGTPKGQLFYAVWNLYIALSLTTVVCLSLAAVKNILKLPECCCLTRKGAYSTAVSVTAPYEVDVATNKHFSQLLSVWANSY